MSSEHHYYQLKPAHEVTTSTPGNEKDRWLKGLKAKPKHPKVRTGCLTCKQRRLKCDEGRPTCQRCAVSGRSCGGYSPPAFVIAEQPSHENFDTPLDGEVLRYFMQEGTTLVSSYANGLKRFSSLVAAQLDQDYPAVKYALLSLAARTKSAHLRWDSRATRNDAISLRSSSLAHYNAAIRNLTPSKNKQHAPPEVYLICGLLFAATEQWPHKDMVPAMHIVTAFKLLLYGNDQTLSDDLREAMLPFIAHLGRCAVAFYDNVPKELECTMREFIWFEVPPKPVPCQRFDSVDQAYEHLDELLKFVLAFTRDDMTFHQLAFSSACELASEIRQTLLISEADPEINSTLETQLAFRSMLMNHRTLQVMLDATSTSSEMQYDWKTSDFEFILYEAEEFLKMERIVSQATKVFRPTLGILSPLFFVATKCRIPDVRRQAVKALHASQRRERTWNSCIAAMLACLVINIEEAHREELNLPTCGEQHRIRLHSVCFDQPAGRISVSYKYSPYDEHTPLQQEALFWKAQDAIDNDFECVGMSKKVLQASGYTGILLLSPRISCQCAHDNDFAD